MTSPAGGLLPFAASAGVAPKSPPAWTTPEFTPPPWTLPLIVVRHAVHTATKVAKWLTENEDKIRWFFLPAYSPELNPDELPNQDLKSNAFRKAHATDKQDMMSKTRASLRSNQRRPGKVRRYFDGPWVVYTAAA